MTPQWEDAKRWIAPAVASPCHSSRRLSPRTARERAHPERRWNVHPAEPRAYLALWARFSRRAQPVRWLPGPLEASRNPGQELPAVRQPPTAWEQSPAAMRAGSRSSRVRISPLARRSCLSWPNCRETGRFVGRNSRAPRRRNRLEHHRAFETSRPRPGLLRPVVRCPAVRPSVKLPAGTNSQATARTNSRGELMQVRDQKSGPRFSAA